MRRLCLALLGLVALVSSALAQGPGPVPSYWVMSGAFMYYPGGILSSPSVAGGYKGPGTYNINGGYYVNGVLVSGLPSIAPGQLICNKTGAGAVPTACSWGEFAAAGVGTIANSFPFYSAGAWGLMSTGQSVLSPGTGALEMVLPTQTVTGTSKSYLAADLFTSVRRSNSGSAMTDTFPSSSTAGMVNGTRLDVFNVDATGSITLVPGAGTTIAGPTLVITPGRYASYVYDFSTTTWRPTYNTVSGLLSNNNLSDLSNATTARANLSLTPGTGLAISGPNLNLQPSSAGVIGGINSIAAVANNWVDSVSTAGLPHLSRPTCSSLSDAGAFCNGTAASGLTGTLAAGQFPAQTGDVTNTAGSLATTIAGGVVTNAKMAASASGATIKGNPTASGAAQQDFTVQGLTSLPSPSSTLDFLLIYDHVSGTFKSVTPGAIAGSVVAGVASLNGLTGALVTGLSAPGGRLTPAISGGVAICQPTTDQVAMTTLYYAPCNNPYVPLYNGTNIQAYNFTSGPTDAVGLSLVLGSNWSAGLLQDVFVTLSSGVPTLCTVQWASSSAGTSTRATALATYGGFSTNATTATCRNTNSTTISVAANQGTYLGTFLVGGSAGTIDLQFGSVAVGGGLGQASIWNAYNRVGGSFVVTDSNTSWAPTLANTYQPYDPGTGGTNNRVRLVSGSGTQSVRASMTTAYGNITQIAYIGIGLNVTNAMWTRCATGIANAVGGSGTNLTVEANCSGYLAAGLNFLQAIQFSQNTTLTVSNGSSPATGGLIVDWSW